MELSLWALALLICKLSIYLGFAAMVGGVATVFILGSNAKNLGRSVDRYLWVTTFLALLSTVLAFFVQVGALAGSGLSGMWHPLYRTILWSSSVGESTLWRGLGFALMLVVLAIFPTSREVARAGWFRILTFTLWIVALLILALSFSLVGHVTNLTVLAKLALGLHVIAISWWMGALFPLWLCCKKLESAALHRVMRRFGQLAKYVVASLIVVGIFLATQLLGSVSALWLSSYGQMLSIKLFVVFAILLLAFYHKIRLVPEILTDPKHATRLTRSIRIELILGLSILLSTAALTTLVGPSHAG